MNLETTIQAAGVLLERVPGKRMSYMRLLKLLYLADREMLRETGRPITFDVAVAMDNGPVLSETYNVIKGEHVGSSAWAEYFHKDGYSIHLRNIPPRGLLSRKAIELLLTVQARVEGVDDWALVEQLHNELEEWIRNKPEPKSAKPIPLHDILLAVGYSEEDATEIRQSLQAEAEITRLEREFVAQRAKGMRDAS